MFTARDANGRRIPVINDGKKNTIGFCPCCGKSLLPKVGRGIRRPHWAHCHAERCDEWRETETDWHLKWRKWFLDSTCDVALDVENVLEKNGEKHFYDARFAESLSIILRRARLAPDKLRMRERFFGNMIWVIEANATDYKRLSRQIKNSDLKKLEYPPKINCYRCMFEDESFFSKWMDCSKPIVFDFSEASKDGGGQNDRVETNLWVVLPKSNQLRFAVELSREEFINRLCKHGEILRKPCHEVSKLLLEKNRLESANQLISSVDAVDMRKILPYLNGTSNAYSTKSEEETLRIFAGNSNLATYWGRQNNA